MSEKNIKWLILSDIHSNMEALNACIDVASKEGYDRLACLGDFVGYGPNPNEVVEWAIEQKKRDSSAVFIMGNHDEAISNEYVDLSIYNPQAGCAIQIQRKMINNIARQFLSELPKEIIDDHLHFVHGSPMSWDDYIHFQSDANIAMRCVKGDICFIGHTHCYAEWKNSSGEVKIVNVGSVGQSRDYNPKASFIIYESVTHNIKNFRVTYDINAVQEKMKLIKMPNHLINRLERGM